MPPLILWGQSPHFCLEIGKEQRGGHLLRQRGIGRPVSYRISFYITRYHAVWNRLSELSHENKGKGVGNDGRPLEIPVDRINRHRGKASKRHPEIEKIKAGKHRGRIIVNMQD